MSQLKIKILDQDVEVTHIRGSGPGGQNRNKRMSGIRIKHIPTGIVVEATERRSQEQNRSAAIERLTNKLKELFTIPKARLKTKVTRSSKNERLAQKKKESQKKQSRRVSRGEVES